ncbi:MAG TPA: M20/M25/M40 family metallo-hydrolase [Gemmatimonadaceae bacterium]|nr:M20/M25/M40 family metallo-hydrolase [Gemmatimonadaceae bacterium]
MRTLPLLVAMLVVACGGAVGSRGAVTPAPVEAVDGARLLADLALLADDSMRGRRAGSAENAKARAFIADRFAALGLRQVSGSGMAGWEQPFAFAARGGSGEVRGANVVGMVRGTTLPDRYLVVTAHFDHVGVGPPVNGDSIYNGADDNASGTAGLLAIARALAAAPPRHSVLLVAFDAEEMGLRGARAFVADPPVPIASIAVNVNMDMVSHSDAGELYAAGAAHSPRLRAPLERVAARAPVTLRLGHDRPVPTAHDDWTDQSDQGAFHERGIPFVYFGVEDHPDYHRPSDEVRTITPEFFVNAVTTVLAAVRELDRM